MEKTEFSGDNIRLMDRLDRAARCDMDRIIELIEEHEWSSRNIADLIFRLQQLRKKAGLAEGLSLFNQMSGTNFTNVEDILPKCNDCFSTGPRFIFQSDESCVLLKKIIQGRFSMSNIVQGITTGLTEGMVTNRIFLHHLKWLSVNL